MHLSDVRPANLAAVYLFVSGEPIPVSFSDFWKYSEPFQPGLDASYNNMSCIYSGDTELHPFAFRTHTHAMGRVVSAYFKHDGNWQQIGKRNPQVRTNCLGIWIIWLSLVASTFPKISNRSGHP